MRRGMNKHKHIAPFENKHVSTSEARKIALEFSRDMESRRVVTAKRDAEEMKCPDCYEKKYDGEKRGVMKNFLRFTEVGIHSKKEGEVAINIAHICAVEKYDDNVTMIFTEDGFQYRVQGNFEDILNSIIGDVP